MSGRAVTSLTRLGPTTRPSAPLRPNHDMVEDAMILCCRVAATK